MTQPGGASSYIYFAKAASYDHAGRMTSLQLPDGDGLSVYSTQTWTYNNLGQMTRQTHTGQVDIEYVFSATQNDGRITNRRDLISGEDVEYLYDSLGRMTSAATVGTGGWGQSFTFDGFGNLTQQTVTKGSAPSMSMTVNAANNRLTGTGIGSDAAGNLTSVAGMTLTYDGLGRVSGAAGESYVYGPRNERVLINKGGGVRELNVYGVDGLLYQVWRHDGTSWSRVASKERIYFAGRLIRVGDETVATDRLGSVVYRGKCALENMGFESSTLTPWAPYGEAAIASSTTARTGSKSMRLTVSVADRGAYRDFSGLKPGTVYTVRAYARAETTTATAALAVSDTTGANMAWSGPMSVSIFWQQFRVNCYPDRGTPWVLRGSAAGEGYPA